MSIAVTLLVSSFSPSTGEVFLCVGNTSGNMDLAALEVESKASLAGPVERGDCLMIGRRK